MQKRFSIKHSFPAGDLLALLPGLKRVCNDNNSMVDIYQRVNLPYGDRTGAYPGAAYSIKDDNNNMPVTMNAALFQALSPLLLYQEYINSFERWDGHEVDFDFDILRMHDTTMPFGSINRYHSYIYPDMATDLSKPWLTVPDKKDDRVIGKILINRTERYNNMLISYNFLKKYEHDAIFVGLPHEHELFCQQNNISISRLDANDFLEIAIAMKSCKFYIGGQSSLFQVAEGLKINRILEVCKPIPNVIGSGPGFYDFLHQAALEYYVDKLYNEK